MRCSSACARLQTEWVRPCWGSKAEEGLPNSLGRRTRGDVNWLWGPGLRKNRNGSVCVALLEALTMPDFRLELEQMEALIGCEGLRENWRGFKPRTEDAYMAHLLAMETCDPVCAFTDTYVALSRVGKKVRKNADFPQGRTKGDFDW